MQTKIKVVNTPIVTYRRGYSTVIRSTTLQSQYGEDFRSLLDKSEEAVIVMKEYTDIKISDKVNETISYVDSQIESIQGSLESTNSSIVPIIEQEMSNENSTINSSIQSLATTGVDSLWGLSELTTNISSAFGDNAANITDTMATYALNNDVGAIAQVALDINGNITGWTAVNSSAGGSAFKINADTFSITNGVDTYTPLAINATTGELEFNGKVKFENTTGVPNYLVEEDVNWQAEVQTAINDDLTTIDGGKIVTNTALVNNLNALGGIIASDVTADTFNGKTFNGGTFHGGAFYGAVLKASYLDLDGELEVLTNYHIPVATYNANPTLYSDAVYIETDNEYRIPSISTVREASASKSMSAGQSLYGVIKSYNVANVGHNNKAVKIRPTVGITNDVELLKYSFRYSTNNRPSSTTTSFTIYIGGQSIPVSYNLATVTAYDYSTEQYASFSSDSGQIYINGALAFNDLDADHWHNTDTGSSGGSGESKNYSFSKNGVSFFATCSISYYGMKWGGGVFQINLTIKVLAGSYELTNDFISNSLFRVHCNSLGSVATQVYKHAYLNSSIYINNMI